MLQSLEENQVFEQLLIFQSGNLVPKEIAHLFNKTYIYILWPVTFDNML